MLKKDYQKISLPNGVRVILVPMDGVNSVATAVMVGVGSRYETPAINGISHFLEHMVFKGTKKYPTTDDVNAIERMGGLQNAYTDIDVTNYHNKVLSTDWQRALEINKELALKPLLLQKHVDKERDVILEEMKRYEDEPAAKVGETLHSMMYPRTTLGMKIIGEEKSLRAVASGELRQYHDAWYAPERMVVILAGNLNPTNPTNTTNPTNKIREKTEEWFGRLEKRQASSVKRHEEGFDKVIDKQDKPKLVVVTKPDASQAHLTLGVRTFARDSQDRYAWSLFNLLMGVSFTSRLFREVREKRGLCYHVRSSSDNWQDVGYWSIYAGVATDKVEEATRAILHEVAKAADGGVTEAELRVAKKRIKTMLAFKSEDPEFMTEFYGRQELYHQPMLTLEDYIKKLEKVTKEDINRLTKKYLVQRTLNMALVWNKARDEKLEKLLVL